MNTMPLIKNKLMSRLSLTVFFFYVFSVYPSGIYGKDIKQTDDNNGSVIKIAYLSQKRGLTYLPSMKLNYMKSGYQLAFKEFNNSSWAKDNHIYVELVDYDVGTKDVELIQAFYRAVSSDALAVVGLDTSKEALLVADLAQKYRILTLSASAAHDDIGRAGEYMYSGSNSISSTVKMIEGYIEEKHYSRVLVISNYDEPYSKKYADDFMSYANAANMDIRRIDLAEGRLLSENNVNAIREKEYDAVLITTYPYTGVMILNQLLDQSIIVNQPVLVSQVWYFDEDTVKKYLKKPASIICMAPWYDSWKDSKAASFVVKYKKEYNATPLTDDAHTFDMANILLQAIRNTKEFTRETLMKSFQVVRDYNGATGRFYYDNCSRHPRKNYYVLQMNNNKEYELLDVRMKNKDMTCR